MEATVRSRRAKRHTPNATTIRAIQEAKAGLVYCYDSVEEMMEHLNEPDDFTPNACTIRALEDAEAGRTFKADSVEDLIHQILG